jgi:hypothetical protein
MTREPRVALLSSQGTACPETVLLARDDTPENRAKMERTCCRGRRDDPLPSTWTDVTDNDAC